MPYRLNFPTVKEIQAAEKMILIAEIEKNAVLNAELRRRLETL